MREMGSNVIEIDANLKLLIKPQCERHPGGIERSLVMTYVLSKTERDKRKGKKWVAHLDIKSIKVIETFFKETMGFKPDFIYPGIMFDTVYRKENNFSNILVEPPNWDIQGCYVFFEPCNQNNQLEVMYVGRSKQLRSRISGHWRQGLISTNVMQKWFTYCWDNDFPFVPYVAIFKSEDPGKLEQSLMSLHPRFNVH